MKIANCLAALAVAPLLAGPALGNPRRVVCATCAPPVKVIRKTVKVPVKVPFVVPQVHQQLTVVEKPVFVREAVSYLATILPASTYNITTNVQTPQPQQVGFQVGVSGAQFGYGQTGQVQTYQREVYGNPQGPPQAQPPLQQRQVSTEERLDRLETAIAKLCNEMTNGAVRAPVAPEPAEKAPPGVPKAFGTKCAACHNAGAAPTKGGKFVMFTQGVLTKFTPSQKLDIATKCYKGEMPPPNNADKVPPLTDEEVSDIMEWAGRK